LDQGGATEPGVSAGPHLRQRHHMMIRPTVAYCSLRRLPALECRDGDGPVRAGPASRHTQSAAPTQSLTRPLTWNPGLQKGCRSGKQLQVKRHSSNSARNPAGARGWSGARRWPASGPVSGRGRRSGSVSADRARSRRCWRRSSSARPRSAPRGCHEGLYRAPYSSSSRGCSARYLVTLRAWWMLSLSHRDHRSLRERSEQLVQQRGEVGGQPRSPACSCSISLPGPLAYTPTGRILITTSPAGGCGGNFDPTPARLMSTAGSPAAGLTAGYAQT
jgi:hypothetical protein